jgi:glycosyltransferase involved in cell wall biosynthesis
VIYEKNTNTLILMLVRNAVSQDARVLKEALTLANNGYIVVIIGLRENGFAAEESLSRGLHILRVKAIQGGPLMRYLGYFLENHRMLLEAYKHNPVVVHCHDLATLPIGLKIKNRLGCKLIFDAHEIYESQGSVGFLKDLLYKSIYKKIKNQLDGFITINESLVAYYEEHHSNFPEATLVMNAAQKTKQVEYDGRLHKACSLQLKQRILLYQGGYAKGRGLEALVQAGDFMPDGWSIVLMGCGTIERELRKRAGKNVIFLPPAPQQELGRWTAGATIGIIPYENSGLNNLYCTPNKLWEYPAANIPVLAAPRKELKKFIGQYDVGWLLEDPLTPQAIAGVIKKLTEDQIQIAAHNCQRFIEENHWGIYEKNLLSLYQEVTQA